MKKLLLLALAPLAMIGAHASAQTTMQRTVVHPNGSRTTTVVHTGYRRGSGRYRTRRVCSMEWRHHRRVRVCRTVRYRPRYRTRRVCTMQWRHHHRVRVCRTVRYRPHWS